MMRRHSAIPITLPLLVLFVGLVPLSARQAQPTNKVIERTLPNGLKVLMVKDPVAPLVSCYLAFRVGSVNERPGITGVSHMHEHMMFKGTQTMGIKPGTPRRTTNTTGRSTPWKPRSSRRSPRSRAVTTPES